MASYYNISGYQGDYIQLTLSLKDTGNSPINLSGYEVRGQVRASYGATGITLNLNPEITNSLSGIITIDIDSDVSANLPVNDYVYDIERYPSGAPSGNSIKLMRGIFSVLPEVTR
jgi:hypothetical protein